MALGFMMLSSVGTALAETLLPLLRRPSALQFAALCHRMGPKGREVLLVTSSHGRWILPKGWPIAGKSGGETALQEAWEEAGVKKGEVTPAPLGLVQTVKHYDDGPDLPCDLTVYGVAVSKVANDFPEASKRERRWVSVAEACELVEEPGIQDLLQDL